MIRERNAVAGAFPGIARDFVGATKSAGGNHDRLRLENPETSALAVIAKRAHDAIAVLEQRHDRLFHVNRDALMNAVILQRANHFQTRAVADVRQARIAMAAEIALRNFAFLRAIKHRASFEFVHAGGRFLGVQFRHAPVVDVLATAHCVGEMDFPVSRSSTLPIAAAMPPSAMTVCALPRSDLQMRPTLTPTADASIAARSPAPPRR